MDEFGGAPTFPKWKKKVLIFGTRTFSDYKLLRKKVEFYTKNFLDIAVVSGTNKTWQKEMGRYVGADYLGETWAMANGVHLIRFHPDPDRHGSPACFHIRNREMVEYVAAKYRGFAVCFWDGVSKGTKETIELCRKHKIPLKVVRYK